MSEIKVDTVGPRVDNGTLTIGAAGDTVNIAGTAGTGFPAGTTINNNADNRVITGSGTADTLNGESGLIFDGSKLGIGTSTMTRTLNVTDTTASASTGIQLIGANDGTQFINFGDTDDSNVGEINYDHTTNKMLFRANDAYEMSIFNGVVGMGADAGNADQGSGLHIKVSDSGASAWSSANQLIVEKSGDNGITLLTSVSGESFLAYGDSDNNTAGMLAYHHSFNHMTLFTGGAERMRIDGSGIMYIQTTAAPSSSVQGTQIANTNSGSKFGGGSSTSTQNVIMFYNGNGEVGKISTNGSNTTFATSSDYRLKENVDYTFDATTRLKQLKPARFNFIADADTTVDGFLAHEVSSIVPEAVVGTKDATESKTNVVLNPVGDIAAEGITEEEWTQGKADGIYLANSTWHSSKDVPVYQSIDQSKLVPLLIKTIQELEARITTLENA